MSARKQVGFHPDVLAEKDPLRLKERHPGSDHKLFYKICISIPVMISFALCFFMIFYISPRGETMQLFQKGIYEWNKDHIADHMNSLQFEYRISPTAESKANTEHPLAHQSEEKQQVTSSIFYNDNDDESDAAEKNESEQDFQDEMRSIYFY